MSKLTQKQLAEMTPMTYYEYLTEQVEMGEAMRETFDRYHLAIQMRFFDDDGVNRHPIHIVTATKQEMSAKGGDYRRTMENQGYVVRVLYDPTGEATARHENKTNAETFDPEENTPALTDEQDNSHAKVGRPRKEK